MKRGETGSSFTCIDLHAASNREDSEKLRLLRPVCLGDDVRDIRVLRRFGLSFDRAISLPSAFCWISLALSFSSSSSSRRCRSFRGSNRTVSRDLTAGTSLHDDSAIVQHPGRTEGRWRGMILWRERKRNIEMGIKYTRTQDSAILVLQNLEKNAATSSCER